MKITITKPSSTLQGPVAQPEVLAQPIDQTQQTIPVAPFVLPGNNPITEGNNSNTNLPEISSDSIYAPKELTTSGSGYGGDLIDKTPPVSSQGYEKLDFQNPAEMLAVIDDFINSGRTSLHPWQLDTLKELGSAKPTMHKPYRLCVCAANGSGKDLYVIAPFVIWFAVTKIRGLVVITSSSGTQLTAQTENYISHLAKQFNALYQPVYGKPIFKVTRRFVKCLLTGTEIRMFATDEAGKAEGYHPLEPDAEMAIVVNEGKSVSEDIFGALSRCTGYNYWLNVSTPGEPSGSFYKSYNNWPRKKVTAFDCPHASLDHIENLKRDVGEHSALFRSQVMAEFTTVGGNVVIGEDTLNRCIGLSLQSGIKSIKTGIVIIGADLAAGGDECVFVARQGNSIIDWHIFREVDTTITAERLIQFARKHNASEINADDGGVGHGIIDQVERAGMSVNRVLNQSRAFNSTRFRNRGAEMWFNFNRMLEERVVYLPLNADHNADDKKLIEQLIQRHYKKNETLATYALLSKPEEKLEYGIKSPDRADALVLAFSGETWEELSKLSYVAPKEAAYTIEEIGQQLRDSHRSRHRGLVIVGDGKPDKNINLSIEQLLKSRNN